MLWPLLAGRRGKKDFALEICCEWSVEEAGWRCPWQGKQQGGLEQGSTSCRIQGTALPHFSVSLQHLQPGNRNHRLASSFPFSRLTCWLVLPSWCSCPWFQPGLILHPFPRGVLSQQFTPSTPPQNVTRAKLSAVLKIRAPQEMKSEEVL